MHACFDPARYVNTHKETSCHPFEGVSVSFFSIASYLEHRIKSMERYKDENVTVERRIVGIVAGRLCDYDHSHPTRITNARDRVSRSIYELDFIATQFSHSSVLGCLQEKKHTFFEMRHMSPRSSYDIPNNG
jgi:hypothetical protein